MPLDPETLALALLEIRERADDDDHAELAMQQLLADAGGDGAPPPAGPAGGK